MTLDKQPLLRCLQQHVLEEPKDVMLEIMVLLLDTAHIMILEFGILETMSQVISMRLHGPLLTTGSVSLEGGIGLCMNLETYCT